MEWLIALSLLPVGGAVAARLRHCRWQAWVGWGGASLVSFIGLTAGPFIASRALLVVLALSVLGFLGPELWEAVRVTARRPKTWLWLGGAAGASYLLFHQEIWAPLLTLAVMLFGIRVMFGLPKSSSGQKKKK